jgi:hypothetical protein
MNFESDLQLQPQHQHGAATGGVSTVTATMPTDSTLYSSKNRNPRDPPERRSRDPREAMASPTAAAPAATSPTSIGTSPKIKSSSEQRLPSPTLSSQRESYKHVPNSDELLCDYESAPSTLYSLLEASHWTLAATRCKTHPTEVRTWVVRRDRDTNDVRWTLLPIHAAVIFQSPTSVVEAMLEHYPQGASRPDDQGMLPLHLAFRHQRQRDDEHLLEVLLTRYPEAVRATDVRGRTPIDLGRDATVSTTFMRRYTNVCVQLAVATAALQASTTPTPTTTASSSPHPETASSALLYEASLSKIKQDYALQITRLNDVYETRITRIERTHREQLQKQQEEARIERQNLVTLHYDEMKCLHEVVASTHDHETAQQTNKLTLELEVHKSDLERCQLQNLQLEKELKKRTALLTDVKETMNAMSQDMEELRSAVDRQREELEAAQSMRMHLLRTLLQQEDDDAPNLVQSTTHVQNLLAATKLRFEDVSKKLKDDVVNDHDNGNKFSVVVETDGYDGSYEEVAPIQDDEISAITDHSNNYVK